MAIVAWPDDVSLSQTVVCITCAQDISLTDATAGLKDIDDNQAFACNRHFLSGTLLIRGWAAFSAEQRQGYKPKDVNNGPVIYRKA